MSKPLDGIARYACWNDCAGAGAHCVHVAHDDDLPVLDCPECGRRMTCVQFTPDGPAPGERAGSPAAKPAPTAIYLAARYGRRAELIGCADDLRAAGYEVTSRWLTDAHLWEGSDAIPSETARRYALEDLEDIDRARIVVCFTEGDPTRTTGRARGGRHVEFGYALAKPDKMIVVVGPRENVFYHLPAANQCADWSEARRSIATISVLLAYGAAPAAAIGAAR